MFRKDNQRKRVSATLRLVAVLFITAVLAAQGKAAQDSPSIPLTAPRSSAIQTGILSGESSLSTTAGAANGQQQPSNSAPVEHAGSAPTGGQVHSDGIRRITLEQAKQSVAPARTAFLRLGQLSVDAAKQHRRGVQGDYFPKFGATFVNLHYTEFLGDILSVNFPRFGIGIQRAIPLFSQNETIAALTFTQPITPLLQVHQLVRIARADERIAMAKAAVSVAKNASDREVEDTYFKLLIAQRKLTLAQLKVRGTETRTAYPVTSGEANRTSDRGPELADTNAEVVAAATEVRKLSTALSSMMGLPGDTELELVPPEPWSKISLSKRFLPSRLLIPT